MKMPNNLNAAVASLTAIALLACWGCGKPTTSPPNPSGKATKLVATHSIGLCNLIMFVEVEKQMARDLGAEVELKFIPNPGDHAAALASGTVDVAVTPFSNVLSARGNGAPIKIISGCGLNGLYIVTQPEIDDWKKLAGKKIGTFRSDTLEVMAYDAMKKAGFKADDFQLVYFTDPFEFIQAFRAKRLDAITLVEPYVTQLVTEGKGRVLAKGQDVWGGTHPDCVLVASQAAIKDKREALKSLIAGLLKAEAMIETNMPAATALCATKYYKSTEADIAMAASSQPPGVDIRDQQRFIMNRGSSLLELGYLKHPADTNLFDFSMLTEVIKEHPEIYSQVAVKAK